VIGKSMRFERKSRDGAGLVTAHVEAGRVTCRAHGRAKNSRGGNQNCRYPRGVLASPQVEATRAGLQALGKDPARYRGSAEALRGGLSAVGFCRKSTQWVNVINLFRWRAIAGGIV